MEKNDPSFDINSILHAIAFGNTKAFTSFYYAYRKRVFQVMFKMTRSIEISQDLTQQFFIKVWERRNKFASLHRPEAYVYTIMYNMATDYLRRIENKVRFLELDQLKVIDNGTQEHLDERQVQALIQAAIETLPETLKSVVSGRNKGLSYEYIASNLGLSKGTTQNYYHEALKQIRQYINRYT